MTHVGTKQAVLNLIEVMENSVEIGFNMGDWVTESDAEKHIDKGKHACKTTCCFAGFAVYGLKPDGTIRDVLSKRKTFLARIRERFSVPRWDGTLSVNGTTIVADAEKSLAITDSESDELFAPGGFELSTVSFRQGIRVLKNFARTGEIDWQKYLRANQQD